MNDLPGYIGARQVPLPLLYGATLVRVGAVRESADRPRAPHQGTRGDEDGAR